MKSSGKVSATKRRMGVSAQTVSPKRLRQMGIHADAEAEAETSIFHGSDQDVGLLQGLKPSDVSQAKLQAIIGRASSPKDLFGVVSNAELIELIFQWFGHGTIDIEWFDSDGKPTIIPSPHNRPLQAQKVVSILIILILDLDTGILFLKLEPRRVK